MKLIKCNDCKSMHAVTKYSTGICWCSHCYFKLVKDTNGRKILVHGPCTVWYIPDEEMKQAKPGSVLQIQWMREPHKNVKRVDKGHILFLEE